MTQKKRNVTIQPAERTNYCNVNIDTEITANTFKQVYSLITRKTRGCGTYAYAVLSLHKS